MKAPSHRARQQAKAGVDELLRLPDFEWGRNQGLLISSAKWNVWAALGALTVNGRAAKRQLFVQNRVLTMYGCAIKIAEENPRINVDSRAFEEALHHKISRTDPDITKHVDASELGRALHMFAAAFHNREDGGEIQREESHGRSTRFQVLQAAAEWQALLGEQREIEKEKEKEKEKSGPKTQAKTNVKYEEEEDKFDKTAATMAGLSVSEFEPTRLPEESDAEYILRLQDKVRDLRTRGKWNRAQVEVKDEKIRKQKIKIEELRQLEMEEDEEDGEEEGPGSDPFSSSPSSPSSPWASLTHRSLRGAEICRRGAGQRRRALLH